MTPREHFDAHLYVETDECKVWPFSTSQGYGQLWVGGRNHRVHVLACTAWNGPRPGPRLVAAHGPCHDRRCWNGAHLAWATRRRNALDRHRDGTTPTTLTEEVVLGIRARYAVGDITQAALAAEHGVCRATIGHIVTGRFWSHLDGASSRC